VFLVLGSGLDELYFFFHHTRSITTDYGVELSTMLICDVLPAFTVWVSGKFSVSQVAHLIDTNSRLMKRCLRIGGWSHTFGHVMESACKTFAAWPGWLSGIRCLLRIFRNASYRKHIMRTVRIDGVDLNQLLKEFTASLAKWRFETFFECLRQLAPLSTLCEQFLRREVFDKVQEEGDMTEFMRACKDKSLWVFIRRGFFYLLQPLEQIRRWGLLCPCHAAQRAADRLAGRMNSFRHCMWNSRIVSALMIARAMQQFIQAW
jgi:hypothetical protein